MNQNAAVIKTLYPMMFTSITELSDAIISGRYLAEDPDLPFENVIYEPVMDFETALVMNAQKDAVSFSKEKHKQSFDLWLLSLIHI